LAEPKDDLASLMRRGVEVVEGNSPFGDGNAAGSIVRHLAEMFGWKIDVKS
jgi:hypothetical protein